MEFLWVLLWMCVGGTERKKKGRGKEKGRGGSRKRTERVCLHFFFFFPPSRCELALVVLQADATCCAHYQQRLSSSGLLTMATLFMVWS